VDSGTSPLTSDFGRAHEEHPVGRLRTPADIAPAALFLASPAATSFALIITPPLVRAARSWRAARASRRRCDAGSCRALPRRFPLPRAPCWSTRSQIRCRRCADDPIGAIQAHRGLDRARAERVCNPHHRRARMRCRRQFSFGVSSRERWSMRSTSYECCLRGCGRGSRHRVGREVVGEAQRHHRRRKARLHVEGPVAAACIVGVPGDFGEGVTRPAGRGG